MYNETTCRFAKTHEWAFAEGGVATVGISDYAQKEISDIVFVELPKPGAKVEQGKAPSEDALLAATNKWLIGHAEGGLPEGSFLGLVGENLDVSK